MNDIYYEKYCKYKKKYISAKKNILKGGKYTNKIKLNIDDLNIFKQVYDLCWLHTGLTILFFSDCFRDEVWNTCFFLSKNKENYYIPVKSKFFMDTMNRSSFGQFFWYFIIEIIRHNLVNITQPLPEAILQRRPEIYNKCNQLLQDLICKDLVKDDKYISRICDYNSFGGYVHEFINLFCNFFKINLKFQISNLIPWNNSLLDLSLLTGISAIVIMTNSHITAFLKINNKWCYYNNELDGKVIIKLTVKKPTTFNQLLINLSKISAVNYNIFKNSIYNIFTIKRKLNVIEPEIPILYSLITKEPIILPESIKELDTTSWEKQPDAGDTYYLTSTKTEVITKETPTISFDKEKTPTLDGNITGDVFIRSQLKVENDTLDVYVNQILDKLRNEESISNKSIIADVGYLNLRLLLEHPEVFDIFKTTQDKKHYIEKIANGIKGVKNYSEEKVKITEELKNYVKRKFDIDI